MFTQVTALLLQLGTRRSLDGEGFVASWRRERSYVIGWDLYWLAPVRCAPPAVNRSYRPLLGTGLFFFMLHPGLELFYVTR